MALRVRDGCGYKAKDASGPLHGIDTTRKLSNRCGSGGQFRTPWHANGARAAFYTLWNRVMQTCLTSSISVEQPSALDSAPWGVPFSGYHKNMGGTLAPKALPSRLGQWREIGRAHV